MKNMRILIDSATEFGDAYDVEDALTLLFQINQLLPTSSGTIVDFTSFNIRVDEYDADQDKEDNSGLKDDPANTEQNIKNQSQVTKSDSPYIIININTQKKRFEYFISPSLSYNYMADFLFRKIEINGRQMERYVIYYKQIN